MPYTTNAKNTMLDALPASQFASAHTGLPGDSGASEVSGGSYAREAITFAASASANRDSSTTPAINIPAGTTVTHVGYWTALTGGTFLGYKAITSETFTNEGTLTVSDADLTITDL